MCDILVVVEDELSAAIVNKLVSDSRRDINIARIVNERGNGSIKNGIDKYKSASHVLPHIILTDLDRVECPPKLLENWNAVNLPNRILFNVAVKEVEAWLLADREGISEFLDIALNKIPRYPEEEQDPKLTLINLSRKSRRRRLAIEMTPEVGSSAQIGPLYNQRLIEYVNDKWDINRAKALSNSLDRIVNRLDQFLINE